MDLDWPVLTGRPGLSQAETDRAQAEPEELSDRQKESTHEDFVKYVSSLKSLEGKECDFCHYAGHSRSLGQVDLGTCSSCHIFTQETLLSVSDRPLNVHQIFCQDRCTMCHDAHSARNEHLLILNQPIEKYCVTDIRKKKAASP